MPAYRDRQPDAARQTYSFYKHVRLSHTDYCGNHLFISNLNFSKHMAVKPNQLNMWQSIINEMGHNKCLPDTQAHRFRETSLTV